MTAEEQRIRDDEHLKLLPIFYYVMAGMYAFFAFFPLIYVVIGFFLALLGTPAGHPSNNAPPAFIGWIFIVFGLLAFVFIIALAALKFFAGRFITQRRRRVFCMVVAGLSCISMPYGTALGIWTFIVLSRPTVRALFGDESGTSEGSREPA